MDFTALQANRFQQALHKLERFFESVPSAETIYWCQVIRHSLSIRLHNRLMRGTALFALRCFTNWRGIRLEARAGLRVTSSMREALGVTAGVHRRPGAEDFDLSIKYKALRLRLPSTEPSVAGHSGQREPANCRIQILAKVAEGSGPILQKTQNTAAAPAPWHP